MLTERIFSTVLTFQCHTHVHTYVVVIKVVYITDCAVISCPTNSSCISEGDEVSCRCNDGFQRASNDQCIGKYVHGLTCRVGRKL